MIPAAQHSWVFFVVFAFHDAPNQLMKRLDCIQARRVPSLFILQSHAVVTVQNMARHCFAEISRNVPEKYDAWMAPYVAPRPI